MHYLTLLTDNQCKGDQMLDMFKIRGVKSAMTDFAILNGGFVSENDYTKKESSLSERTGAYWTQSREEQFKYIEILGDGNIDSEDAEETDIGIRPVLEMNSLEAPSFLTYCPKANDGVYEVEYGNYPQNVPEKGIQEQLENAYNQGTLIKTGNYYTSDSREESEIILKVEKFSPVKNEEYVYNGKKYIRVKARFGYDKSSVQLSNGEVYNVGDFVWVEIQPIKWLLDKEEDLLVSEKTLFSGVELNYNDNNMGIIFEETYLKNFLDNYLGNEIIQNNVNCNYEENKKKKYIQFQTEEKSDNTLLDDSFGINQEIQNVQNGKQSVMHKIEETKEYVEDGAKSYINIGLLYDSYLRDNSKGNN